MSKKKEETGLEGFDALSREDFIASITDGGPSSTSNDTGSNAVDSSVKTDDPGADAIIDTLNKREKEAKASVDKKQEDEGEEEIEEKGNKEEGEEDGDDEVDKNDKSGDADKKENKEEVKDKKDKDKKDPDTGEEDFVFKNPDEAKPPVKGEESGDTSWLDVAKELSLELKEDTFDAFREAFETKAESNIAKYKPETQRLIKFTEAGGSADDFVQPFSKIDAAISLSDADLVDQRLKLTGWDDDTKREAKLQRMVEDGEIEIEANNIRKELYAYKEQVKDDIIDKRVKAQEIYEKKAAAAREVEAKAVREKLNSIPEFMMTKVSPENVEYIVNKFKSGGYEKDFKDEATLAEFFLYKEFGKVGISNIETKVKREVERKYLSHSHNVPPKNGKTGSVKATPSGQDPEGNWEVLEREKIQSSAE